MTGGFFSLFWRLFMLYLHIHFKDFWSITTSDFHFNSILIRYQSIFLPAFISFFFLSCIDFFFILMEFQGHPWANPNLVNSWVRNNNMMISSIFNSISEEISASIIYVSTAYEIWNDLKEKFQKSNGPWIFQLRRDPMNLTQDQNSISAYFTKLKTMWDELSNFRPNCSYGKCTCSGVKEMNKHYQMEYITSFLMGIILSS